MTRFTLAGVAALAALVAFPLGAQAENRTQVGVLDCQISPGVGMIVTSRRDLVCEFRPNARGWKAEKYVGTITRFGVDLGATTGGRLAWGVFAPSGAKRYALAGRFGGASAEVTVAGGVGANVLVGGNQNTISLQPVSVQGQTGLNVAAGVAGLELHPASKQPKRRR
jgi:hypothetical protein